VRRVVLSMLMVLAASTCITAKDWRGIVPMHSTREDVEAILGPPPPSENRHYTRNKRWAVYLVDDLEVFISYTDEDSLVQYRCGSAVAAGVVSLIRVTPKTEMFVSGLNLNEESFKKYESSHPDDSEQIGLLDTKEGLAINALKGKVQEIIYFASASDGQRCPLLYGNPEDLVLIRRIACLLKFDEYGNIRFADEKARLDNFSIQLLNEEGAVGYIIAYAGRKAVVAEAMLRANRARDYLINVRKINPERLKAIDGGHREDLTVELHILPAGAPPPSLDPTVDPKEVEIIYKKPRSRKN
jgi:hypothetical protein